MTYGIFYKVKVACKECIYRIRPKIIVKSTKDTMITILLNKVNISRFGDGEFSYILKLEKIGHQNENMNLRNRLLEILNAGSNKYCLVCIPYASYSLKPFNGRSRLFWFKYYALNRKQIDSLLNVRHIYYDSQISRIYINRKKHTSIYFDMWKKIWENKKVLIVEGEKTRFGFDNDLFANTRQINRLLCPSESAYDYYDNIYSEVLKYADNYDLILIALGITATVLAWDLSKIGVWAIDIGNMDNEYEWYKLGVKRPVALKNKYVYEAEHGKNVIEVHDYDYLNQIIARIGIDNESGLKGKRWDE